MAKYIPPREHQHSRISILHNLKLQAHGKPQVLVL